MTEPSAPPKGYASLICVPPRGDFWIGEKDGATVPVSEKALAKVFADPDEALWAGVKYYVAHEDGTFGKLLTIPIRG